MELGGCVPGGAGWLCTGWSWVAVYQVELGGCVPGGAEWLCTGWREFGGGAVIGVCGGRDWGGGGGGYRGFTNYGPAQRRTNLRAIGVPSFRPVLVFCTCFVC